MVILVISTIALTLLCAYLWHSAEHWKSQYELSQCELRTTESILKELQLSINQDFMTTSEKYVETLGLLRDTTASLSKLWGCIRTLIDKLEETDKSHAKVTASMMEAIKELAQAIDLSDNRTKALIDLATKDLPKKPVMKKKITSDKSTPPKEEA